MQPTTWSPPVLVVEHGGVPAGSEVVPTVTVPCAVTEPFTMLPPALSVPHPVGGWAPSGLGHSTTLPVEPPPALRLPTTGESEMVALPEDVVAPPSTVACERTRLPLLEESVPRKTEPFTKQFVMLRLPWATMLATNELAGGLGALRLGAGGVAQAAPGPPAYTIETSPLAYTVPLPDGVVPEPSATRFERSSVPAPPENTE